MATKSAATKSKAPGTALVDYKAQLAAMATDVKEVEAGQIANPSISFKSGVMTYMGAAIKDNAANVSVVGYALENAYYNKDYDADNPVSPVCFALGTGKKDEVMKPHVDSELPQSETCASCKWNVFGSADKGKGKACRNVRRLALIHEAAVEVGAKEVATSPIVMAKLSPTSGPVFSRYVNNIANVKHVPPIAVISRMALKPHAKNQFEVTWEFVRDITDNAALGALMGRIDEARASLFRPYSRNAVDEAKPAAKGPARKRKY